MSDLREKVANRLSETPFWHAYITANEVPGREVLLHAADAIMREVEQDRLEQLAAMERAGAEQARRADENAAWAKRVEQDRAALAEALGKYGRHKAGCPVLVRDCAGDVIGYRTGHCDCGLDAALAGAKGETP